MGTYSLDQALLTAATYQDTTTHLVSPRSLSSTQDMPSWSSNDATFYQGDHVPGWSNQIRPGIYSGSSQFTNLEQSALADRVSYDTIQYRKSSFSGHHERRRSSVMTPLSASSEPMSLDMDAAMVDPSALSYMTSVPRGWEQPFTCSSGPGLDLTADPRTVGQQPLIWNGSMLESPVSDGWSHTEGLGLPQDLATPLHPIRSSGAEWTTPRHTDWLSRSSDTTRINGWPAIAARPAEPSSTARGQSSSSHRPTLPRNPAQRGPEERGMRTDPRYQAKPFPDGLYHCPYDGTCGHRPTKLKCNYE